MGSTLCACNGGDRFGLNGVGAIDDPVGKGRGYGDGLGADALY